MDVARVIPCLDVTGGRVVKGTNFVDLRDAGDPVELAARYDAEGADELVFLDITASSDDRETTVEMVRHVAEEVYIPFTVGGGIRTIEDARRMLRAGADKVSVNTAAVQRPELIARVYETHPEVAFWRLNGKAAMAHPKKVKSALEKVGLRERQALLEALGLPASLFDSPRLPGVGTDDLLDAAANVLIACRIADGMAEPFPAPLEHDARGLPIAIWV